MRSLNEIAREIIKDWSKPYFGAKPYIDAMLSMICFILIVVKLLYFTSYPMQVLGEVIKLEK